MTRDFTSVTLFFVALRDALLAGGLVIEREVGFHDLVFTTVGGFARLRRVAVSSAVSAISLTLGSSADELAVATDDPELCLPFDTTVSDRFSANIELQADPAQLQLLIAPNSTSPGAPGVLRCYRAQFDFVSNRSLVRHEDPPNSQFEPNFRSSGGSYIGAGV